MAFDRTITRLSRLLLRGQRTDANTIAAVPLTVEALTGQTGALAKFKNSAGTVITQIGADGVLAAFDSAGLQRIILNGTTKDVPDASATALFDVACASGAMVGGVILATIEASNGTDHQAMTVVVTYAAVNKAGTHTCTI